MWDMPRNIRISYDWLQGMTLQEVGDKYGITRERVRQILKKLGLSGEIGGKAMQTALKVRYVKKDPATRFLRAYGCTKGEVQKINNGEFFTKKGTPAQKFMNQKRCAIYRGIEWKITFIEWWSIWQESGKWEMRGRGQGYCMARIGDTGPYSADNVEIKTIGENFSESYYKHPWRERFADRYPKKETETQCSKGHDYSVYGRAKRGECKECLRIYNRSRYLIRKQSKADNHAG